MTREAAFALVRQLLDAAYRRDVVRLMDLYGDDAVASDSPYCDPRAMPAPATTAL